MSSSGEVTPLGSADRAGQLTSKVPSPEELKDTWPLPSIRLPSQCAAALRVVAMRIVLLCEWGNTPYPDRLTNDPGHICGMPSDSLEDVDTVGALIDDLVFAPRVPGLLIGHRVADRSAGDVEALIVDQRVLTRGVRRRRPADPEGVGPGRERRELT